MEEEVLIPVIQALQHNWNGLYFKRSPVQVRRELEKLKRNIWKAYWESQSPSVKMIFDDFGIIYKGAA